MDVCGADLLAGSDEVCKLRRDGGEEPVAAGVALLPGQEVRNHVDIGLQLRRDSGREQGSLTRPRVPDQPPVTVRAGREGMDRGKLVRPAGQQPSPVTDLADRRPVRRLGLARQQLERGHASWSPSEPTTLPDPSPRPPSQDASDRLRERSAELQ